MFRVSHFHPAVAYFPLAISGVAVESEHLAFEAGYYRVRRQLSVPLFRLPAFEDCGSHFAVSGVAVESEHLAFEAGYFRVRR